MTVINAQVVSDFRTYYPEFTDKNEWPDAAITRHLEDADDETGSSRWGDSYQGQPPNFKARGLFAYAAHRLVLAKARERAVAAAAAPGAAAPVQSKSGGDECVTYATQVPETSAKADQIGDLRSTAYGQEVLRLRRRAGAGVGGARVKHL